MYCDHPRLVRICFESLTPAHLVLRLIGHADPAAGEVAMLRSADLDEGQSYCLIDALIDDEMRCAAIFQVSPHHRLVVGGVYPARDLDTDKGLTYLEFLRNPRHVAGAKTRPNPAGRTGDGGDQQGIDGLLTSLLLNDGELLRSATLQDLTHLTAEQNYVRVHLASGENIVVRGPLQKYEDLLPDNFARISRHMILNLSRVQRLRRISRDLGVVSFEGGGDERSVRIGRKASILVRSVLLARSGLPMNRAPRPTRSAKQAMGG